MTGQNSRNSNIKYNSYQHPLFRYLNELTPKNLKSLFLMCENLFLNANINAGIRKIAEYPVTEPEIYAESEKDAELIKDLFTNTYQVRREITKALYNLFVYGNSFVTFTTPFERMARCTETRAEYNVSKLPDFYYEGMDEKTGELMIRHHCPMSGKEVTSVLFDRGSSDLKKCVIVHWDPKRIDINHNPTNKRSEYYYEVHPQLKRKIEAGDRHTIATMSLGILKTVAKQTKFLFDADQIFHMKMDSPTGIENGTGWGIPILFSAMETYMYMSTIRKGNQSVALERVDAFRMVYPQTTGPMQGPGSGIAALSQSKWLRSIKKSYEKWRQFDRNQVFFSPVPAGVSQVGGDARPLLLSQEVQAAESALLGILGIPKEFVYGGMSYGPGSGAVIRQLENQLIAHTSQASGLLQWIANKIVAYRGMKQVTARMGKFKLQDDMQQKTMAFQMHQAGQLSNTTFMRMMDYDAKEEQKLIYEERIDAQQKEMKFQKEVQSMQDSLAEQAALQEAQGGGMAYNPQVVMAKAHELVNQMAQAPQEARAILSNLQNEDPVMYAVVSVEWEKVQRQQGQQQPQQGMM